MKANAERIEKNTILLEIEVDAEHFSQAVDKAYRKLVKQVNIPGFRKGKAPRQIFERFVGKEPIYEEAMDALVPEAYLKAVEENGIEPIDRPQVEVIQAEEGKPVLFKATVQVKPEVKLGQYKELEVQKQLAEVTDEDVEKELERLCGRHAKLLTLEEGMVEKGDIAVIDFLGKVNGEPFEGGEGKDYSLEIGSGAFIEGFEDQVIGMSVGETRDIQVTFPENYQSEELAGKEATFTVAVKEIKRKELAALDDEFAKDVSEFDTLQELREDISNKLKQAAENRAAYQIRQEVIAKAVDNSEVEVPELMIDQQVVNMYRNLEVRLSTQGLAMKDYLGITKTTPQDLMKDMRPEAERSVKSDLVIEAVAKAEGIKATEEDIDEEIKKMAAHYRQDAEELRKSLEKEGHLDTIAGDIVNEKTAQFLVEKANVVEDTKEQASE